jgi:hypothetical protein
MAAECVLTIRRLKTAQAAAASDEAAGVFKPVEAYDQPPPPPPAPAPTSGAAKSPAPSALKKQKTEGSVAAAAAVNHSNSKAQHKTPTAANPSKPLVKSATAPGRAQPLVMADKPTHSLPSVDALPEPTAADQLSVRQGLEYDTLIAKLQKQVTELTEVCTAPHRIASHLITY